MLPKRCISFLLALVMVMGSVAVGRPVSVYAAAETPDASEALFNEYTQVVNAFGERFTFDDYLERYSYLTRPTPTYTIDAAGFDNYINMYVQTLTNFEGMPGVSVLLSASREEQVSGGEDDDETADDAEIDEEYEIEETEDEE
jgi:hypothetical protein